MVQYNIIRMLWYNSYLVYAVCIGNEAGNYISSYIIPQEDSFLIFHTAPGTLFNYRKVSNIRRTKSRT